MRHIFLSNLIIKLFIFLQNILLNLLDDNFNRFMIKK